MRSLSEKRSETRKISHNPEVSGKCPVGVSNPLPATNENRSPWGYGFLIPKGAQSEPGAQR